MKMKALIMIYIKIINKNNPSKILLEVWNAMFSVLTSLRISKSKLEIYQS